VSRDLPGHAAAAITDLTHLDDSASEEEVGLPPSTAPPRLEDPTTTKRTRGKTLDFVALHTGTASKKTRQ
jgi:hypothetical protein